MSSADPNLPGLGDIRYAVLAYDLTLDYTVASNHLQGRARIACRIAAPTDAIALDLTGLKVLSVRLEGATLKKYGHTSNRLTLRFGEVLDPGTELTVTRDGSDHLLSRRGGWAGRVGGAR